jgi:serpin B
MKLDIRTTMRRTLAAAVLTSLIPLTACGSSTPAGAGGGDGSSTTPGSSGGSATTTSESGDAGLTVSKANVPRDPSSGQVDPTANNAFATDLFSRVAAAQVGQNAFTSPVSASLALTMAYAGAKGETATQMAKALHFDPASNVFAQQNAFSQELAMIGPQALATAEKTKGEGPTVATPSAADYHLDVINAVWGQQGVAWASPFLDTLARDYGTGVTLGDFMNAPDAVRQTINT